MVIVWFVFELPEERENVVENYIFGVELTFEAQRTFDNMFIDGFLCFGLFNESFCSFVNEKDKICIIL